MMTVLITGASSDIGAGLAKFWADDSCQVIACGRDRARLATLRQYSPNVRLRVLDMTDSEACLMTPADCNAALTVLCVETCEYLDQGVMYTALVEYVMSTNFLEPVSCLTTFQDQRLPGSRVAWVNSMAYWLPLSRVEAYGASKTVITWFANSLSLDWEPKSIAITVVSPGFVNTPLTRKNDFSMPCQVNVDDAVKTIRHELEKGKKHITFPTGIQSDHETAFRGPPNFLQRRMVHS